MLKENFKKMMQKLNFPLEAQNELLSAFDTVSSSEFFDIINRYNSGENDFDEMLNNTKLFAEERGVSPYKAYMVLLLCLLPMLLDKYIKNGFCDEFFYNTMQDLRYKLQECYLIHGVYGTFVPKWYKGFFEMRIFALGRLQFEKNTTWFDCDVNGLHIPKGTNVLSVHIPRTETPLLHEQVLDSYRQAVNFFKDYFKNRCIFICNSWLLYPWNRSILKDESNLAQFYDDFTVVMSGEYQNYSECWRLFDCLYDGNPDNLPANTSLRRSYIERIKSGKPIGHGTGVIVFDE
ncbi:MAG: DUF5596 domain-containing protein [Clostridia bacterium]|nr:DUF5596 domain-containing protein [Clostridia bacterium]